MTRRSSLKEYQDEILKKMELARSAVDGISEQVRFFGFSSSGKKFLIDASKIVEMTAVSRLQPIPMAKPWAAGAANIKGTVYSVTDFGMLYSGVLTKSGKFVILDEDLISGSALLIDDLTGIYEQDVVGSTNIIDGTEEVPDWIIGVNYFNNDRHYMISVEKLIEDDRFIKLQSGE